MTFEGLKVGR